MKPVRTVFLASLVAAVLATATFVLGTRLPERSDGAFDVVAETAREIQGRSTTTISQEELARAAIRGMLRALDDPYAAFLDPEQAQEVEDLVRGSIVGIGVWLESSARGLRITSVVDGTPAARADLRSGDVIVRVDEHPMGGVSVREAARLLKGEIGETVELVVERGSRTLEVTLRRQRIEVSDLQSQLLEEDVAYVRLLRFGRGAGDELRAEVRGLLDRGATAVVLDLRSNPGGLADEAVSAAGVFMDGVVARLRERGKEERELRTEDEPLGGFPVAVLVDGGTASASELVAGALQDRGRATIVGTRTFGKGSVLTVTDVDDESKVQYTTALFFTPGGRAIEGEGITPDVQVLPGGPEDAQLARAVELLTE